MSGQTNVSSTAGPDRLHRGDLAQSGSWAASVVAEAAEVLANDEVNKEYRHLVVRGGEARSQSRETLEAFYDLFISECASIEQERGVEFQLDRRLQSAPATMDPAWVDKLRAAARKLGLPDEPIPSGAGHDAAVFANAGIPSAMIFIRNEPGSHNPREDMAIADFMAGVAVMRDVLAEAAL
jgi:acetylornithine deacetylase/succinyl-diaminopimelate desuccinylase-like protein